jgi:hypothetical protein
MSRTIQMMNEDGTPFFANLHAPSTVQITIAEAYSLVDALKTQRTFNETWLASSASQTEEVAETRVLLARITRDLDLRIDQIESAIDHDKYEQWASVAPAWAIRAGVR